MWEGASLIPEASGGRWLPDSSPAFRVCPGPVLVSGSDLYGGVESPPRAPWPERPHYGGFSGCVSEGVHLLTPMLPAGPPGPDHCLCSPPLNDTFVCHSNVATFST